MIEYWPTKHPFWVEVINCHHITQPKTHWSGRCRGQRREKSYPSPRFGSTLTFIKPHFSSPCLRPSSTRIIPQFLPLCDIDFHTKEEREMSMVSPQLNEKKSLEYDYRVSEASSYTKNQKIQRHQPSVSFLGSEAKITPFHPSYCVSCLLPPWGFSIGKGKSERERPLPYLAKPAIFLVHPFFLPRKISCMQMLSPPFFDRWLALTFSTGLNVMLC